MVEIGRIIGLYVVILLMIIVAYVFAYEMDERLCKMAKNKKIIQLKCLKLVFMRYNRKVRNDIFVIAFIHELIAIALLITATVWFIISLCFGDNDIIPFFQLSLFIVSISYAVYTSIISRSIKKKREEQNENTPKADDQDLTR